MDILDRDQVINAADVDGMIGTSRWTVRVRGSFGRPQSVSLEWIEGTHNGYMICRQAEMQFYVKRRGRSPDEIYEDKHVQDAQRQRSSIGEYEIFTNNLLIAITAFSQEFVIQNYLCVPTGEAMNVYNRYPIGRFRLWLGKILGSQTGR